MLPYIIGSRAMQRIGVLPDDYPVKDFDILVPESFGWQSNSDRDVVSLPDDLYALLDDYLWEDQVLCLDAQYTLRLSHMAWDIKWEKHKRYALMLYRAGASVIPELYGKLKTHWESVNGSKDFLSLKQDKKEFFNDHVDYIYDHDYLHELVAYPREPMYRRCLKGGEQVLIDKGKFDRLPFQQQLQMFREEITVICAERWMIPKGYSFNQAWNWALKKTVTSLTKGWAADFIIHNLWHFERPRKGDFEHLMKTLIKERDMKEVIDNFIETYNAQGKAKSEATGERFWEIGYGDLMDDEYTLSDGTSVAPVVSDGGEGEGEYAYCVIKMTSPDGSVKHYKLEYNYYSYSGFDYDNLTVVEVVQKEKVVMVWE